MDRGASRDISIDILRGIAIFTMVAANTGGLILTEPHPIWFRLYGSFAAPLFILLSGMMVLFTNMRKDHGANYFVIRGMMVITLGVLMDIVYQIYPFMTCDVLYLIGLSLPVAYFFSRLRPAYQLVIVLCIFLLAPVLQKTFGYASYPIEVSILTGARSEGVNQHNVLTQWLWDGWFPVFPWLGFSLLGVVFGNRRWKEKNVLLFKRHAHFLIAIGALGIGTTIWRFYPGIMYTREGYSEIFYPPTVGYILIAVGAILALFYIVDLKPSLALYRVFQVLGESALFMYIVHIVVGKYVISPIWPQVRIPQFCLIYLVLTVLLILMGYSLRWLKEKWSHRPFIIKFLLGG
jgi:uncharacterized membrane protein